MGVLIPYVRDPNAVIETTSDEDGVPILQSHLDKCPACTAEVLWWRDADAWVVDDNGKVIDTEWLSWFCECDSCGEEFTIPYDDGLAHLMWEYEDES